MRGVARVAVLVGVASACTAPNPAYQAEGDPESGVMAGSETVAEGSTTSDASAGGSSTGEPVCELHPLRPYDIQATGLTPDCTPGNEVVWVDEGSNLYPPSWDRIQHELCEPIQCDCPLDPAPMVEIGLAADAVFADGVALPDCGRMALWASRIEESCQWAGLVMWEGNDILPSIIVSRTLDVPPFEGATPFMLELVPTDDVCVGVEACPDARAPGPYAIDVLGQATVAVEDSPKLVEIQFGAAGSRTYLFDNRMSSINRDCQQQLAWSAQLWQ